MLPLPLLDAAVPVPAPCGHAAVRADDGAPAALGAAVGRAGFGVGDLHRRPLGLHQDLGETELAWGAAICRRLEEEPWKDTRDQRSHSLFFKHFVGILRHSSRSFPISPGEPYKCLVPWLRSYMSVWARCDCGGVSLAGNCRVQAAAFLNSSRHARGPSLRDCFLWIIPEQSAAGTRQYYKGARRC